MTKSVFARAKVNIEIPFHDVDAAEIAWHGHYAKYFEIASCQLLDQIDYNYPQMKESGFFWPVIDMRVRYIAPTRFQQKITVEAMLVEWEHRLKIDYLICDATSGQRLTKGYTCQVAVGIHDREMLLVSPPVVEEKLKIKRSL